MGKVVKIVAGVALVAASFIPGVGQVFSGLLITAGSGLISSGLSSALAKKPRFDIEGIAPNEIVVAPTAARKWCFGLTPLAGDAIYIEQWDDNKKTGIVVAHAGHLINAFTSLSIDGEAVTFSGDNATGKWAGLLTRQQRLGTEVQTAMTVNAGGAWGASMTMRGYAGQALIFTWDQEKNPRGLPTRIQQIGEGSPVYDPRLDSTRGGSGAHRADDQATWEYDNGGEDIGRNAVLVYLTYMIGWRVGGARRLGVGYPLGAIDYASFITAANIAEANGWTFDGVLEDPSDGGHAGNLRRILDAFAGTPIEAGGVMGVRAPNDDTGTPVLTVTEDRLRGDIERPGAAGLGVRRNVALGRYIEPAAGYEPVEYPAVTLADAVTEDGSELPATLDFSATTDPDIAQQLAAIRMREDRQEPLGLTLDMSGFHPLPGHVIELDLPRLGFDGVKVRAQAVGLDPESFTVAIDGKIVKSSDYDLITPAAAGTLQAVPVAAFDELLATRATRNAITSGTPNPSGGENGDLYYETDDKAWWAKIAGTWVKVSDETAANIAAGIVDQGDLATLDEVDTGEIAANAVSVVASAFSAGDLNWVSDPGGTFGNSIAPLQFLTISAPTGEPVQLTGQAYIRARANCILRVVRGVTQVGFVNVSADASVSTWDTPVKIAVVDSPPPGSPVTYNLVLTSDAGYSGFAGRDRFLLATELKR